MDLVSFAFDAQASHCLEKPLYICAENPSISLSAKQTKTLVKQLIAGLQAVGLRKGDAVLVCLPNNCIYIALILAIVGAGGVFCGANPAYQQEELCHIAKIGNPRLVIASTDATSAVLRMCKVRGISNNCIFVLDDIFTTSKPKDYLSQDTVGLDRSRTNATRFVSDLRHYGESSWLTLPDEESAKNTPAIYFPTSGTTGLPKLASLSHYCLIAQHRSLFVQVPYEVVRLASLPLFHIFGVAWALFSPLRYGEPLYIMARFALDDYVSHIAKYAITETYMAPPMVHAINRCDLPLKGLMATVQYIGIGGAPIDAVAIGQLRSYLQPGATVTPVWGMTEFGPAVLFRWGEHDDTGSIGRLIEGYEMKLVDDSGKQVLEDNQPGELLIRSKAIMIGYLGVPMQNDNCWFPTGDIATVKNNKLYVVGRSKELIKVKGWQVAPAELESVIIQHPDIVDCAVVGVMSADRVTELPRAYVVQRKSGREEAIEKEVYDLVRIRLVSYKKLAGGVVIVKSIPRTPSGKVQRFKLLQSTKDRTDGSLRSKVFKGVQQSALRLGKKLSMITSAAGKALSASATTAWLRTWPELQGKDFAG